MAREQISAQGKDVKNWFVLGGVITAIQAYSFKLSTCKDARQGSNQKIPKFKIFLIVELRGNKQTQSQPLQQHRT